MKNHIRDVGIETIKRCIRYAIKEFAKRDRKDLLKVNIYEPTISHRIALYLEKELKKYKKYSQYNVDCEYNKNLSNQKLNSKGEKVRPDIIVHIRRTNKNLCVIEIKKAGRESKKGKKDIKKLKEVVNNSLHYTLGVFIGVLKSRIDICWVERGKGEDFYIMDNEFNFKRIQER